MADPRASTSSPGWRTVDIVVAAVIAVAFGVVFWAWNALWATTSPAFAALPAPHSCRPINLCAACWIPQTGGLHIGHQPTIV